MQGLADCSPRDVMSLGQDALARQGRAVGQRPVMDLGGQGLGELEVQGDRAVVVQGRLLAGHGQHGSDQGGLRACHDARCASMARRP